MAAPPPPIPPGYAALTPYLIVAGAEAAIAFYAQAFGAVEVMRLPMPGGRIGHAELGIGESRVMLADESPQHGARAPAAFGGSPVSLHLYVADVDATVARALAAGASLLRPVADQFYGDRAGRITDPFGHVWHVATHVEDVSAEEMARRVSALQV
jgi:PhnB protein